MSKKLLGNMLKSGVTNIAGISMINATSGMVNSMPDGTAKSIASNIPGLQSTALLATNIKPLKGALKLK